MICEHVVMGSKDSAMTGEAMLQDEYGGGGPVVRVAMGQL